MGFQVSPIGRPVSIRNTPPRRHNAHRGFPRRPPHYVERSSRQPKLTHGRRANVPLSGSVTRRSFPLCRVLARIGCRWGAGLSAWAARCVNFRYLKSRKPCAARSFVLGMAICRCPSWRGRRPLMRRPRCPWAPAGARRSSRDAVVVAVALRTVPSPAMRATSRVVLRAYGGAPGTVFPARPLPWRRWLLGMACAVVPDVDVIGFRFGIHYGDLLGHRGITHSLAFAAVLSVTIAVCAPPTTLKGTSRRIVALFLFIATASHGLSMR